jgi:chromosome segregation ATPase
VGLRTIWDNLTPLLYAAVGVAFSEGMRLLVVAFNQRMVDHETHRQQRKDESTSVQLRRIDDAAEWRRQQELRIVAQDKELDEKDKRIDEKDKRIDALVEANAQLRSEMTACERERDWWQKRYQDAALELNELKYRKREP